MVSHDYHNHPVSHGHAKALAEHDADALWESSRQWAALGDQIAAADAAAQARRDLADGGEPQAFGGDTSCWYLLIEGTHPWKPAIRWDGGAAWDQAGVYWDVSNHDPALLAALKRVIQKWKPAASSCRYIEAWLRVDLFGNPLEIVRFPVWEDWELDASGNARDYFNTGYLP